MVAPATRKPRRSSRGHEKGVAYISAGPAKATAPGWTKRAERKPSTVIRRPRRPGRCSSLQPTQVGGAFPRRPFFTNCRAENNSEFLTRPLRTSEGIHRGQEGRNVARRPFQV